MINSTLPVYLVYLSYTTGFVNSLLYIAMYAIFQTFGTIAVMGKITMCSY